MYVHKDYIEKYQLHKVDIISLLIEFIKSFNEKKMKKFYLYVINFFKIEYNDKSIRKKDFSILWKELFIFLVKNNVNIYIDIIDEIIKISLSRKLGRYYNMVKGQEYDDTEFVSVNEEVVDKVGDLYSNDMEQIPVTVNFLYPLIENNDENLKSIIKKVIKNLLKSNKKNKIVEYLYPLMERVLIKNEIFEIFKFRIKKFNNDSISILFNIYNLKVFFSLKDVYLINLYKRTMFNFFIKNSNLIFLYYKMIYEFLDKNLYNHLKKKLKESDGIFKYLECYADSILEMYQPKDMLLFNGDHIKYYLITKNGRNEFNMSNEIRKYVSFIIIDVLMKFILSNNYKK